MYIEPKQVQKKKKKNLVPLYIIGGIVFVGLIVGLVMFLTRKIPTTSLNFDVSKVEMMVDETKQVNLLIEPNNTNEKINITIDNPDILSYTNNTIQSLKPGKATITAKSENLSCQVEVVVYAQATDYDLYYDVVTLGLDTQLQIEPTFSPQLSKPEKVTYKSLDPNIVKVDENGLITTVGCGKTEIVATALNNIEKRIVVYVVTTGVAELKVNTQKVVFDIAKQETQFQIEAEVFPENATQKNLIYTSSDEKVATVDENGLIQVVDYGKCQISVKASSGQVETIDVYVSAFVESLQFNDEVVYSSWINGTFDLSEQIIAEPQQALESYKITYTSSDEKLATVDENGVVTAKDNNYSSDPIIITVTFDNGLETLQRQVEFFVNKGILWVNGFPKNSTLSIDNPSINYKDIVIFSTFLDGEILAENVSKKVEVIIEGLAKDYVTVDRENCLVKLNDKQVQEDCTGTIVFVYNYLDMTIKSTSYNFSIKK